MLIRPATHADIPLISEWTAHTFDWGDYVPDHLAQWIDNPASEVIVAEIGGAVVGTVTGTMVSPRETWAQGARVHPDHRRKGVATAISSTLWDWARQRGATVARLAVDDSNTPSQAQVRSMGFRKVGDWRRGQRAIGERSSVPEGNGGRRVPPPERLDVAPSAEAEPAFLSWSTGELSRGAHGLLPISWTWRRMTVDHLTLAARNRNLHEGRPGWAIADVEPEDDMLAVDWMETTRDDAVAMALALVDLATEYAVSEIRVWVPKVEWLEQAFTRFGFEFSTVGVWELAL